uniref:Large ribosomal subunit protein mL50 n=1 Tax=Parascaris univalens TaxID=6257 RepID=A0A915B1J6_PARUN
LIYPELFSRNPFILYCSVLQLVGIMRRSMVNYIRVKRFLPSIFQRASPQVEGAQTMSKEQQEKLKGALSKLRTDKPREVPRKAELSEFDSEAAFDASIDMDSIRARGLLKYRYNYEPPKDLEERVRNMITKELADIVDKKEEDVMKIDLTTNAQLKFKLLDLIGRTLKHTVPNAELHRMKTVEDVIEFYRQPTSNLTKYAKMARDETLPRNLYIMEHPVRFHPDDKDAYHGGVTAYPGSGGRVLGLRNKRLYRQFQPKKEWFDYEDQSFDYTRPDKDMPWDPEVAKRMDRYPSKKYILSKKAFERV